MLKLRPYEKQDAKIIAGWIRDEVAFRKWSADRYESYPVSGEDINKQYAGHAHSDTFFPMTAVDETGVVGHMILRFTDEARKELRFGFVNVDDTKRGMGYGKQMLTLAIRYGVETFGVRTITLGVFENNPSAYYCYKAVGFQDVQTDEIEYYHVMGEDWKCRELALEVDSWNCG